MQYSLCIDSIYPQESLKEKLEKIKQAGFKFIEFWNWRDKDFEIIINSGLKVVGVKNLWGFSLPQKII